MGRTVSSDKPDRAALLAALDREMRKASAQGTLFGQAVADRLGIASSDLECLDIINLHGMATAGQLAKATGLTTGAITGVIDRLEKAGYARRERDPSDRRKVYVRALPAIRRRIQPFYELMQREMMAIWSGYSDQELALLIDFATRSHQVLADQTAKLLATEKPVGRSRPQAPKTR